MNSRLQGLDPTARQRIMAAGQALDAGRIDQAQQHLSQVLATHPTHAEALRMHAGILSMAGKHHEALEAMRQALQQRPQDPLYHNTMGTLLGSAGEFDAAIVSLRRCCELTPDLAMAWYNLGVILTRCVRNDEAVTVLKRAVQLEPGHVTARALLADMLRTEGRVDEAAEEYRRVIADQPWAGMAWWGLADLRTIRFSDEDISAMRAAIQRREAGDDDRMAMGFALARALHDAGEYAQSLAAIEAANLLARQRRKWNAEGFSASIRAIHEAFTPPPARASDPQLGAGAIFIVSMPRAGSTLVEQILASHSQVQGAGELTDVPQVLAEESRRRSQPFPHWVGDMQPADWQRLGERYLERTAHWRQERPMATDKLPGNWIYIDAIAAMLPGARIICARRDPLETCFSCYRQRLENNEYTRTFDDLAGFWRDVERSMQRALVTYPEQVYVHNYEALQDDPETSIRHLLDACGLQFEEACLDFHQTKRDVRSPSATQVRQRLSRDTAHTKHYGDLLDPLRAALDIASQ